MKEIKRISAGVMSESDVLKFIDHLAAQHRRHRSFIINQIIRQYVRLVQQQKPTDKPASELIPAGMAIHF